jgi:hypothetical protein
MCDMRSIQHAIRATLRVQWYVPFQRFDLLVNLLLGLSLVMLDVPWAGMSPMGEGGRMHIPEISCWRSPVRAPTTASFLPATRSTVPSTYPWALAAVYSASPALCSSRPDVCHASEPVALPIWTRM